jgi:hypothetical protein
MKISNIFKTIKCGKKLIIYQRGASTQPSFTTIYAVFAASEIIQIIQQQTEIVKAY